MKSLHSQVYLPGFLFPCPFSLTTLVTTSILPVRTKKFQKEKTINNDNWKDRAEINSYTERAGDKESWTGFERIPRWRSSWAVFKNCYCEVLPHTSEVDIIDFHRKRWRTSHLLSSFCTKLCAWRFIVGVHFNSQNQHQEKPMHLLLKVKLNCLMQPKLYKHIVLINSWFVTRTLRR